MQENPHTSEPGDQAQEETPQPNLEGTEQSREQNTPDHPEIESSTTAPEEVQETPVQDSPPPQEEAEADVPSSEEPKPDDESAASESPASESSEEAQPEVALETATSDSPSNEEAEPVAEESQPETAEETPSPPATEEEEATPPETASEETESTPEEAPVAESPAEDDVSEPAAEAPEKQEGEDSAPATPPVDSEQEQEAAAPSPAQELLEELLKDEENFVAVVESSTTNECILLLEAFVERPDLMDLLPKVSMIRRRFDALTKAEDAEIPAEVLSRYHMALARLNRKKATATANSDKNKEENSRLKFELLDRLKTIVEDELVDAIDEVREIQATWKEIGWVLQKDIQNLARTYSTYLDIFYNLRGQYNALRDLDRQHNYTEKEKVIEEVEALIPKEIELSRESWREYSEKVRQLQDHFRNIGPVPRDQKDELMDRYKATLDKFYGARQEYYDSQDEQKKANIALKQAVIDKLQPFSEFNSRKAKDWNQATKEVLQLQEEWKKIGPAPQEFNRELWKLYRKTCDAFFETKSKFFKEFDRIRADNLKKKITLCEQAEELMESENWKETAGKLKELQVQWKTIGPVHDRYSNKVWKRFRKACDHFFNRRDEQGDSRFADYAKNQEIKEELIARLTTLTQAEDPENHVETFKDIQQQWKNTGHVPIKEKDRINNAFRDLAADFYDKLKKSSGSSRFVKLDLISDPKVRTRRMDSEISKIRKKIRASKEKIESYETNILYIAKGKSGDSLRKMIQTQIAEEKKRLQKLKKQVEDIKNRQEKEEEDAEAEQNRLDDGQPLVEKTQSDDASAEAKGEEEE